jgi:hypothetical protein
MNPDPIVMEYIAARSAAEERARRDRQAQLHRAAVLRRQKAKRGGKR